MADRDLSRYMIMVSYVLMSNGQDIRNPAFDDLVGSAGTPRDQNTTIIITTPQPLVDQALTGNQTHKPTWPALPPPPPLSPSCVISRGYWGPFRFHIPGSTIRSTHPRPPQCREPSEKQGEEHWTKADYFFWSVSQIRELFYERRVIPQMRCKINTLPGGYVCERNSLLESTLCRAVRISLIRLSAYTYSERSIWLHCV